MKNKNVWIVAIVVLAVFIAGFLWLFPEPAPDEASMSAPNEVIPVGKPKQAAEAEPAPAPAEPAPEAKPEPAIANPVTPEPTTEPLPKLDESEPSIVTALGKILDKSWMDVILTEALIRKIVATVDHLPAATLPANVVPLKRVSGSFVVQEVDGQRSISPHNAERYAEYMARIDRVDAKKLVTVYRQYYPLFQKAWKAKTGETVTLQQSHGGSSKQAMSVVAGLEADVITMNQAPDIDILAERGGLVPAEWQKRLPDRSSPFVSTIVFIVRQGNPKAIQDWADLAKPGVQVIVPNPKTSGNGRYTYLAAWGQAQQAGNAEQARAYVQKLFANVPVLDAGGRAATTTFMQRQIGDVLVTFENEAEMVAREFGRGSFTVVYPKRSILAENPVSVVDKVVDKKGTRKVAQAYLEYLWSPAGQELAAQNYLRPRNSETLKKYAAQFPPIQTFTVEQVFGGWRKAMDTHFRDGGVFDQIYSKK